MWLSCMCSYTFTILLCGCQLECPCGFQCMQKDLKILFSVTINMSIRVFLIFRVKSNPSHHLQHTEWRYCIHPGKVTSPLESLTGLNIQYMFWGCGKKPEHLVFIDFYLSFRGPSPFIVAALFIEPPGHKFHFCRLMHSSGKCAFRLHCTKCQDCCKNMHCISCHMWCFIIFS